MYEPVIDSDNRDNSDNGDAGHESELTPIFHALSRRATDPVERFRRDPLRAPLPAVVAAPAHPPAMTRMLLSAVPTNPGAHRADPARAAHCAQAAHAHRGGRHRALQAVERAAPGLLRSGVAEVRGR